MSVIEKLVISNIDMGQSQNFTKEQSIALFIYLFIVNKKEKEKEINGQKSLSMPKLPEYQNKPTIKESNSLTIIKTTVLIY